MGRVRRWAESLYVRAGILDESTHDAGARPLDVTDAVLADPKLNDRQRAVLLDVYESFVGEPAAGKSSASKSTKSTRPARARRAPSPAPKPETPADPEVTQKENQS